MDANHQVQLQIPQNCLEVGNNENAETPGSYAYGHPVADSNRYYLEKHCRVYLCQRCPGAKWLRDRSIRVLITTPFVKGGLNEGSSMAEHPFINTPKLEKLVSWEQVKESPAPIIQGLL